MTLTPDQKRALREDGFVHLPGIVPTDVWQRSLRSINASVGRGMNVDDMPAFNSRSFCPELANTPIVTDLVNASPVFELAESAIGKGRLQPLTGGQVALRFPNDKITEAGTPKPHIDGMYTPTNGVKKGTIENFTALVGVFLSDVTSDAAGNFTVWPGSHDRYASYFQATGPDSLLNGMPPVDIGIGRPFHAKAGDAVIAHYLLGHGVASNLSPHIRYACFFRLKSVDHDGYRWETMKSPWLDWHGM